MRTALCSFRVGRRREHPSECQRRSVPLRKSEGHEILKWTEGAFKDWGHCGACANGSVTFIAKVPLWFYAEPNSRYGDFTTETYRKFT